MADRAQLKLTKKSQKLLEKFVKAGKIDLRPTFKVISIGYRKEVDQIFDRQQPRKMGLRWAALSEKYAEQKEKAAATKLSEIRSIGDFVGYYQSYAGLAGWTSLIWDDSKALQKWRDTVNKAFCDALGWAPLSKECWTSEVCGRYADITPSRDGVLFSTPVGGAPKAVAHVEARRSLPLETPLHQARSGAQWKSSCRDYSPWALARLQSHRGRGRRHQALALQCPYRFPIATPPTKQQEHESHRNGCACLESCGETL